jgi:allophanate hydrolase
MKLDIGSLTAAYRSGAQKPSQVIASIYDEIARQGERPVWITVLPREEALRRARVLEEDPLALALPLYGVPFAVKDNIDVAGVPTTAGCPEYSYVPERDATVVARLVAAGAIPIGKTNMDQFATGLVGVRSPYGACSSVFDERYVSGGSSSGSAVAVARELVSFSLGTDTAGSGRVPAAFNNLVGLKPTRGLVSAAGVVPACRTLDCVSIFAIDVDDAQAVWQVASGMDDADPFTREARTGEDSAPWLTSETFRFGVPPAEQLEFFGDREAEALFQAAVERLERAGGEPVVIDYAPFRDAAQLLYSGPWVAERLAAIESFLAEKPDALHPVVRTIIAGGSKYSAVDAHRATYRLQELRALAEKQWERMDVLLLPTTGTIYTIEQVEVDPVQLNTNLGYYTNFVNLFDLAAVAVPAGFRPGGLPFGVSLIGPAFSDAALLELAGRFTHSRAQQVSAPGSVAIAVVGAHLTGQPLNRELTSRGARLTRTCRTAAGYRLYALQNTTPSKPGLVRDEAYFGPGVEVEVWSMPEDEFGGFVAGIPAPLGIGSATLEDGSTVKCFICEPYAVAGSREITSYGGWRKYLAAAAR